MFKIDPLNVLPSEVVLRVIDELDASSTTRLSLASKQWHEFIDTTYQDAVYASHSKVQRPVGRANLSFTSQYKTYSRIYDNVKSWKDLCKRQTLLRNNWTAASKPWTAESVLQTGSQAVWRFRPDFQRRFFVCTFQSGGLSVVDFESGLQLWHLAETAVRHYAHLEYDQSSGVAVFDQFANRLEVWKANDTDPAGRGHFRRIGLLEHDVDTRGFMLRERTLCVVSTEEQAFVYRVSEDSNPTLMHTLNIAGGIVGHLDQTQDVVMFSHGSRGFSFFDKQTGQPITDGEGDGFIIPNKARNMLHLYHPKAPARPYLGEAEQPFPPRGSRKDRTNSLRLQKGHHLHKEISISSFWEGDEWGAGMVNDAGFMVAISRMGRLFICSDWRGALASDERLVATSAIIDCETDPSRFDIGGWLSLKDGKVMWEVGNQVYLMNLSPGSDLPLLGAKQPRIHTFNTGSAPPSHAAVSWMGIFDDCIMMTYSILARRINPLTFAPIPHTQPLQEPPGTHVTSAIRVLSFVSPALNSILEHDALSREEAKATPYSWGRDPIMEFLEQRFMLPNLGRPVQRGLDADTDDQDAEIEDHDLSMETDDGDGDDDDDSLDDGDDDSLDEELAEALMLDPPALRESILLALRQPGAPAIPRNAIMSLNDEQVVTLAGIMHGGADEEDNWTDVPTEDGDDEDFETDEDEDDDEDDTDTFLNTYLIVDDLSPEQEDLDLMSMSTAQAIHNAQWARRLLTALTAGNPLEEDLELPFEDYDKSIHHIFQRLTKGDHEVDLSDTQAILDDLKHRQAGKPGLNAKNDSIWARLRKTDEHGRLLSAPPVQTPAIFKRHIHAWLEKASDDWMTPDEIGRITYLPRDLLLGLDYFSSQGPLPFDIDKAKAVLAALFGRHGGISHHAGPYEACWLAYKAAPDA